MSVQRCSECGQPGHKRTEHDVYRRRGGPAPKHAPAWFVVAFDVTGGVHAWYGPLGWSTAFAIARLLDQTDDTVAYTRITQKHAALHGPSSPLPHGWQDYEPLRLNRGPRVNPGHVAHVRARKEAA